MNGGSDLYRNSHSSKVCYMTLACLYIGEAAGKRKRKKKEHRSNRDPNGVASRYACMSGERIKTLTEKWEKNVMVAVVKVA